MTKFIQISRTGLTSASHYQNKSDDYYTNQSEKKAGLNNPDCVNVYLGTLDSFFGVRSSPNDNGKDFCYLQVPRTDDEFAQWGVYFTKGISKPTIHMLEWDSKVQFIKWLLNNRDYVPTEVALGECLVIELI